MRLSPRFPLVAGLLVLLAGGATRLTAQDAFAGPISVVKAYVFRQTSATTVQEERPSLHISAQYAVRLDPLVTPLDRPVELIGAAGTGVIIRLTRSTPFPTQGPPAVPITYTYSQVFENQEALERALPAGPYTLTRGSVQAAVIVTSRPEILLPRVSNYDTLQRWDGGALSAAIAPTASGMTAFFSATNSRQEIVGVDYPLVTPSTTITLAKPPLSSPGETSDGRLIFSFMPPPATGPNPGAPVTSTQSMTLFFPVTRASPIPVITRQPAAQTVAAGSSATLSVAATGDALLYQWRKNGAAVSGATFATLTIPAAQPGDSGTYSVAVSNSGGSITSTDAMLTVVATATPTAIATHPVGGSFTAGAAHTLSVAAAGTAPLFYQWSRDGAPIAGATVHSLVFASLGLGDTGVYTVKVSNSAGSITSNAATLTVNPVSRISNLSIRTQVGGAAGTLTVGLTIGGEGGTATKPLLLRAIGPTLAAFGVDGALVDPQLAVLSGSTTIAENDDWAGNAQITATNTAVGAFGLASATSKDAALAHAAAAGGYTVRISGAGTSNGVALAEVYDASPSDTFVVSTPRLTNVSALTQVGTGGDILIAGFSITGVAPKTVLVRGIGPALAAFGVSGALADPKLDLFAAGAATAMSSNDNWGAATNATQVAAAAAGVGAFALTADSKDAVLLLTLQPGSYTAQISGVANTTGTALVEVYEVP